MNGAEFRSRIGAELRITSIDERLTAISHLILCGGSLLLESCVYILCYRREGERSMRGRERERERWRAAGGGVTKSVKLGVGFEGSDEFQKT